MVPTARSGRYRKVGVALGFVLAVVLVATLQVPGRIVREEAQDDRQDYKSSDEEPGQHGSRDRSTGKVRQGGVRAGQIACERLLSYQCGDLIATERPPHATLARFGDKHDLQRRRG